MYKTPSEMGPNLKEIIILELKRKIFKQRNTSGRKTNIKRKNLNTIPLSRTTTNKSENNVPVKVNYKIYKTSDIIIRILFTDDIEKRIFVIPNDIICEINIRVFVNDHKITNIRMKILETIHSSGCSYFLAESETLWSNYCSSSCFPLSTSCLKPIN